MGESQQSRNKLRNRPPFLSEFGDKSADLLRKDYGTESQVFRFSTLTDSGLAIRSTAMYKNQPVQNSTSSDSISNFSATMRFSTLIAPGTILKASLGLPDFYPKFSAKCRLQDKLSSSLTANVSLMLPNYESCNISLLYLHEITSLSMGIGLNGATFQASHGSRSFAVGIQTTHLFGSDRHHNRIGVQGSLLGYTASLLYSTKGSYGSSSSAKDNEIQARIHHSLDEEKKISAVLDISRSLSSGETKLTAAGSWAVDDRTVVNARLDHLGTLKTLLRLNMGEHNSVVSISGEFDVKNLSKTPKIGLAVLI